MGRSLSYPNSPELDFSTPDATWYRLRLAGQPDPVPLATTILTVAAAGHGGYLYPPYKNGSWLDPLANALVPLDGLDVEGGTPSAMASGAIAFESQELPQAARLMSQALDAGPLWCLCLVPEHEKIIIATDEDGDLIARFPNEGARQSFLDALARVGWQEPAEPDPRVSETDPWLSL